MHKRSHPCPNKRRWLVVWWSLVPWDRGASWLWRQFFEASWCHETSPSWLVGFAETNASHWALASCSVHPWLSEVFSANWTVNMHICAFINIVIGWVGLWTLVEQAIWLVDLCFGGWGNSWQWRPSPMVFHGSSFSWLAEATFAIPLHHPCYLWANAFVKIGQMVGDEPTQVLQHLGSHLHKSFVIWHPQRSWGLTLIQTGFLLIAITDQIKVVLNAASIACILVSWFFASVCVFMKSTL